MDVRVFAGAEEPIYLDYNATTPLDPAVSAVMMPYVQGRFGNPSSGHWYGVKEKEAVHTARAHVAALINAKAGEIIFTSGGTESANWAIKATAERMKGTHRHIVTSKVEHVVVIECCKYLEQMHGFEVTYVDVDKSGRVSAETVAGALRDDTCLVSIMHANNETGSINDIEAIAQVAHKRGVLFHTDASQSVGKVDVDVVLMHVDFLTIAGHKLYCPAGVGALYVKQDVPLMNWMHGAGHEAGRRAGTENTMHLVALGEACRLCSENLREHQVHLKSMRDLLHQLLLERLPSLRLNGHAEERLPNTLNVSLPVDCCTSHELIAATSKDLAFSAGSACHSGQTSISHVLAAMGSEQERGARAIRLSVGRFTTEAQVRRAAELLLAALQK
mmetsp:Transcript_63348/g.53691  ORF Transcript_63348/g.53691 Transcript_63348/m.53691 type:complete len:388 (+) Transcript_63348:26-1189(+)|eukprot:CAMPEP_0179430304 /NCGR_PEP_ID=MMETSP0799-20121207/15491_1 /TAXON_ID=46947 /ORGANISM="Geminigera cryophila, Strain CCMP2564" /LENGTH=387 /DNA_ID=CAMNT_0021206695 /DNA_START=12 /DNA_END=1175 /DNA_ORIENTATION=-